MQKSPTISLYKNDRAPNPKSQKPARLVILGLDGLPYSLAQSLCQAGHTPNLARLIEGTSSSYAGAGSHAGAMSAELPELSPVNWTSFYTAEGPEEHGVFGFTRINASTYELSLAEFSQVHIPTIFDKLGALGYSSRIINLPNTYPARGLTPLVQNSLVQNPTTAHASSPTGQHGTCMMISGFVAHELQKSVFPPFLMGPLMSCGYTLEADTSRGSRDPYYLLQELRTTLASRRAALQLLWPDLSWDCFVFVLTETDRLFHFLWDAVVDETHHLHSACMDFIHEWDATIGDVLDRIEALNTLAATTSLRQTTRLMVMADHGFTALETEVDLNVFLQDQGYLHLAQTSSTPSQNNELDATRILPQSLAFALDPSRIYFHTRERFVRGHLSQLELSSLIPTLRDKLLSITYQGRPVLKAVHTADELYQGSKRAMAPDLVCEAHAGFDLKAKFNRSTLFGHFGRTGTHTVHDAFFYDSHGFQAQRVRDVGREVLAHFYI